MYSNNFEHTLLTDGLCDAKPLTQSNPTAPRLHSGAQEPDAAALLVCKNALSAGHYRIVCSGSCEKEVRYGGHVNSIPEL